MKAIINEKNKIKIVVIGCGRIAKNHFESIQKHHNQLELIAICDCDESALATYQNNYAVPAYDNLDELIQQERFDLAVICTPSGIHAEQSIKLLENGIHVVCEKPMATDYNDALNMVKAADKSGAQLFVVKQNRRNATLSLLKKVILEERFGRIYMVNINVFWTRPQAYYDLANWRGTWEFDGGAFMNQASHYVDLLSWLIGPIDQIHAMTATLGRKIEAEDTGVVNLRWRSGALGSMNVTMLTYPKNLEGSITILGEKGSVRIGGLAVNQIEHWEFADKKDYDQNIKEANYQTTSVYGFGHPLYYNNVIDVLRGRAEAETDGRSGLKSMEILTAIYRSAKMNRPVALPLQ